jgi:hypothetical protein
MKDYTLKELKTISLLSVFWFKNIYLPSKVTWLLQNTRTLRHDYIFKYQLEFFISVLNFFGDTEDCISLKKRISVLPDNTLGKQLYIMMESANIEFVPWYKEHDFKHALLGYKMDTLEEMKMQAFMWGNSGFQWFTTLMTLNFLIWIPEVWSELPKHYKIGQQILPISQWKTEDFIERDLQELRTEIGLNKINKI